MNSDTGNFTWVPSESEVGVRSFNISAHWSDGSSSVQAVSIDVCDFLDPLPSSQGDANYIQALDLTNQGAINSNTFNAFAQEFGLSI